MAQNAKPAAKAEAAAAPKKSSKKLVLISAVVVVIAAGAGGWFFTKGKHDDSHAAEAKVELPKTPIFVPLETFTVNLQRESTDQYLQLGLTLKVFEPENEAKIKTNLPDIRSKVLQLLTTKTATELLSAEGKQKLIKDIATLSNASIGIVNPPEHPAKPAQIAAASEVAEAAAPDAQAGEEAAHKAEAKKLAEKKGVVDVLFTSFIIQ
jgi:flagellar FliL protein